MQANIDCQLRQDIIDELEFDPSMDAAHIGVAVDKNVVSLTGHVSSYAEKMAAITATRRVWGVHAIAENIEVRIRPSTRPRTTRSPSNRPAFQLP